MAQPTQKDKDQRYAPYAGGGGLAAGSGNTPLGAHIATNTTQAGGNNALALVTFHKVFYDDNSFWSAGAPTKITFGQAGRYQINVQISWDNPGNGAYIAQARLNGLGGANEFLAREMRALNFGSSAGVCVHFSFIYNATAADYIELETFSSVGGTLSGGAAIQDPACRVWIAKQ